MMSWRVVLVGSYVHIGLGSAYISHENNKGAPEISQTSASCQKMMVRILKSTYLANSLCPVVHVVES
jgi:hypothetical protein